MVVGTPPCIWLSPVHMESAFRYLDDKERIMVTHNRKDTIERFVLVVPVGAELTKYGRGEHSVSKKVARDVGWRKIGMKVREQLTGTNPPASSRRSNVSILGANLPRTSQLYWSAEFMAAWKLAMGGQHVSSAFSVRDERFL